MTYEYVARTDFAGYTRGQVLSAEDAEKFGHDHTKVIRTQAPEPQEPTTTNKA